ncbi:MAG TPA: hypothetical protein VKE74_24920 [Gemmataceae bacterium]|nr:hypothetical protein [Gemmataceae bacterium]
MTEREWLACEDPAPMLKFLGNRLGARTYRLFGVACCRLVEHLLTAPRLVGMVRYAGSMEPRIEMTFDPAKAVSALGVMERWADGQAKTAEIDGAIWEVQAAYAMGYGGRSGACHDRDAIATHLAIGALSSAFGETGEFWVLCMLVAQAIGVTAPQDGWTPVVAEDRANAAMADLLRDIAGNPFRKAGFRPEWRTSTVVQLAQPMYESKDFGPMPILADALQDAGCENDDILAHCRQTDTPHVRGCWVVDRVLGKS